MRFLPAVLAVFLVRGDRLRATTLGSQFLVSINLKTAKVENIVDLRPFGGDGVTAGGNDTLLVSDFNGLLLRVTEEGDREVLIDTRDVGISLTDFAFAPEPGLVLIPTLRGNSVMAFRLARTSHQPPTATGDVPTPILGMELSQNGSLSIGFAPLVGNHVEDGVDQRLFEFLGRLLHQEMT